MKDLNLSVIISAVDRMTQPVRKVMQSTDRLTDSVKQQQTVLNKLGRMDSDIKHFRQLRQSTQNTAKSLSEARTKATRLGQQLHQSTTPTRKMQQAFDQARRSVQTLQRQHTSQQHQLQQLRSRLNQASVSTRNLGEAQRRLKQETRQTSQALESQNTRLEKMQVARQRIATRMATAANMMFVGHAAGQVGRTAAGMLRAPVQTAVQFEEAMSGVGAVARASAEQITQLTNKAKELGATTRYSASEAAAGMKYLAMAGFSAGQITASLPGVMNMATAGAADLGRASDIASDILSAFGLEATEMERVADTLTATFTRANTKLEMLGESMKYVGPVARTAGMSLEETAAMAGLLGNVGIKSSMAGTTLRAMLQGLAAPTGAAADTLQTLGIEVHDLEGNLRSVPTLLGELAEATASMGSGERLSVLKTLFDAEAAAGVSELIGQEGARGITRFTAILKEAGTEATRVAQQMDNNAAGGFRAMNSAIEGMQISFGDLLLPAVRAATDIITGLTRRMRSFIHEWPTLSRWVGFGIAAIAGLAFAFSGLMMVLASTLGATVIVRYGLQALGIKGLFGAGAIKALTVSCFSFVGKAVPVMLGGLKALTIALMTNPMGLLIGSIALAAGLIIANWEKIGSWFSGLWAGVKELFTGGWNVIKKVFSFSPLGLVMKAWGPMLEWISGKIAWVGNAVSTVTNLFSDDDESSKSTASKKAAVAAAVTAAAATPVAATPATSTPEPVSQQYTLQIHQQPGEDAEALAERVMARLREKDAHARSGAQYDQE
ncbi:phage tail tape measure protein [Candidatus Sororendozoicomonas aggregata]|uniref:phage tail tape measure protein n=1 Tax=Candidatus Sororendozoicomonas aggregata TaxID=3073239 RepID=UPI002ED5B537